MKKVFMIIIVFLLVLSWGSIVYRNGMQPQKYSDALEQVRQACNEGYYVEAQELLDEAELLQGNTSSYEADILQRDIYYGLQSEVKYVNSLKNLILSYPNQMDNYEMLVQYYYDNELYEELNFCVDDYLELWPDSDTIQSVSMEFSKQYQLKKTGYYEVKYISGDLVSIRKKEYEEDNDSEETYVNYIVTNEDGKELFNEGMKDVSISVDRDSLYVCDQNGQWSMIDQNNNLLSKNTDVQYEWIGRLGTNGIAPARIKSEYHYINRKMHVNDLVWDMASLFNDDMAAVCRNGKWAIATTDTLTELEDFPYLDIAINDSGFGVVSSLAVVEDDTGYYVLDTEEMQPVSENRYEKLKAFNTRQPAAYRLGNKWGFVSPDGTIYIEAEYEDAKSFANGYAAVKKNGLWGIIDRENRMVVEPQFHDIQNVLDNGYVFVLNDADRWDIIIIDRLFYK